MAERDGMMKTQIFRDGKVHVLSEQCATCIFRPGNLMRLSRGRVKQMVRDCLEQDTTIICHDTLHDDRLHAACRGFYDLYWPAILPLRFAREMGKIEYMKPPEGLL